MYSSTPKPANGLTDEPAAARTRFRSLSDPESLREFAKNLREGIYITSRDGRLLDANQAFLDLFGVKTIAELGEYGAANIFVDIGQRAKEMQVLDRDGSAREFELELQGPDGRTCTVLDTCYLICDPETHEQFIHGILIDITARKRLEASLREASTHDPLTGALNRRYLMDVEETFAREPERACGCIFVDIDNFKIYNDKYGHIEGDEVLKKMTRFLWRYVRSEETVLRVGGDEFVVMLRDAGEEQTKRVADRLRMEALEHAPVPFSLGYASRRPGEALPHLLDRADQGLLAVRVIRRQSDPRQRRVPTD